MKFVDVNELRRRIVERPDYAQARDHVEECLRTKVTSDEAFVEANRAVGRIYDDEIQQMINEMGD